MAKGVDVKLGVRVAVDVEEGMGVAEGVAVGLETVTVEPVAVPVKDAGPEAEEALKLPGPTVTE